MQVGYRHKSQFFSNSWLSKIAGRAKCQKHLPTTKLSHHAPLAIDRLLDVRTTKWRKQLPTTMQCRSHSRRHTVECLFVAACIMDQYAEEKRTEKNLTVCSGISEAKTTNNKRLRSTFFIEAIQTRSIARPLCDSRASCLLLVFKFHVVCPRTVRTIQYVYILSTLLSAFQLSVMAASV